ncbi:MAG: transporter substrate-binding domain-containing protein, partial [Nautiliaceae bacterium]
MKQIVSLIILITSIFAINYSEKEKEFLKNHPVIYFSAMEYWPVDENGSSLHINYIKLLNKYGKLNIQPIFYKTWNEGFKAAKEGKTYGIMALSYSKKRENFFFYTPAYNYHPYYLITLKKSNIISLKDLKNKTVFIAKNSIIREKLKNPPFNVIYSTTPYKDLASEKIDAILTFYMPTNKYIKNLKTTKVFIDKSGEEHIGINKQYPLLYYIILKAQKEIPYEEIEKIKEKYYFNPMPPVKFSTQKITLKDLIEPIDLALITISIVFLFLVIYYFITKKYLHLNLKPFLIGIFLIETIILGLIVYEIIMFNYYSKKILEIKSRSFNELFLTDKMEESILKSNKNFLETNKTFSISNMIVLNTPLKEYFSPKYFHPATLSKIANIKMNLQKLLNLQQEV